ncbi:MAG: nucleoside monophosphate kinase [Verrucomicrobiae bacterium]|nr:nucleoside monophosphate kinase [Verrucomicrobiae bacterium]MDW7980015.1 nucleoside monophosphate kinase [Verrucomicrobiales bacterium]
MDTESNKALWLKAWLEAVDVKPALSVPPGQRVYRLVLLGAPGVGKGTQAELMSARLGPCHLATGDIFRAAKALDPARLSPALREALKYMDRGELVPDETVVALVRERAHCLRWPTGFLLDGFPRTVPQAEALEQILANEGLKLDAVLNFESPVELIIARLSGRRTCPKCKAVFHIQTRKPRVEGVCDNCGTQLIIRDDDRPEAIRVRLEVYQKSTAPLVEYYRQKGLLVTVPSDGPPEEVYKATLDALAARR